MKIIQVARWGGKHLIYLPAYVAEQESYFSKSGLDIRFNYAGNDDETYQQVLTGRAAFGIGDPTFVTQNQQVKVLASLVQKCCLFGYTHYPEIYQIKTISDFVSLRFGVSPAPSTAYALIANLRDSNFKSLNSMQIIEGEIGNLTSLFLNAQADVILDVEPMVSMAEEQGLRVVLNLSEFYSDFLFTGIYAHADYIASEPEVVQKFIQGMQMGLNTCYKDFDIVLKVASNIFPALSLTCLKKAIRRMLAAKVWPRQVLIQVQSWQNALQLRSDLSNIENTGDFLDQSFACRAVLN